MNQLSVDGCLPLSLLDAQLIGNGIQNHSSTTSTYPCENTKNSAAENSQLNASLIKEDSEQKEQVLNQQVENCRLQMIKAANDLASLYTTTSVTHNSAVIPQFPLQAAIQPSDQKNQLQDMDEDEYTTNEHVQRVRNAANLANKGSLGSLSIMTSSMSSHCPQFKGISLSNYASNTYSSSPSSPSTISHLNSGISLSNSPTSSFGVATNSMTSTADGYFSHNSPTKYGCWSNSHAFGDSATTTSTSSTSASLYVMNPWASSSTSSTVYIVPKVVMNPSMHNGFEGIRNKQPAVGLKVKKSISLQTLGNCSISPLTGKRGLNFHIWQDGMEYFSKNSNFDCIDLQSVLAVEWLRKTSILRFSQLFDIYSSKKAGFKGRSRRLDVLRNLRNIIKSVRPKGVENMQDLQEKTPTKSLYGMPLSTVCSKNRSGYPLPLFVINIMDFLADNAANAEGIFRKNGVKRAIQEVKDRCSALGVNDSVSPELLSSSQLNDLADALKQYFRELPECLMTQKVSIMLENSVTDLPEEKHFLALQYCILLLPSEHREALMILLRFLNQIAKHSSTNQMTEENLATCLMPSLFCLPLSSIGSTVRIMTRSMRRKSTGMPNEKERNAYNAIKQVLTRMIREHNQLLYLPKEIFKEVGYSSQWELNYDLKVPTKNGIFDFHSEDTHKPFKRVYAELKKDFFLGWKRWTLERVNSDGTQVYSRDLDDGIPLQELLVQINFPKVAPLNMVHAVVLHNRHVWDRNVTSCQRIGTCGQNYDVLKVSYHTFHENIEKTAYLGRWWSYSEMVGGLLICSLIERSIIPVGGRSLEPRINIYKSAFLFTSNSDSITVTYCARIDLRGKTSSWYKKVYADILVAQLRNLRLYFLNLYGGNTALETLV